MQKNKKIYFSLSDLIEKNISLQPGNILDLSMKYSELHKRFIRSGWIFDHAVGSHYFYTKDGIKSGPIPFHGSKEIPKGLAINLIKKYNL
ncbi:MAG: type II toxin-antitoxin system HicA family toxin [Bacteroidales bacterium]|nr:type II toxin-antitoxin system HicA family toxin [Bacteroidales bacterium]MCR5549826.1 type II toxin-antitoxin system HicA family toxin [Bacteroidales bacterium]